MGGWKDVNTEIHSRVNTTFCPGLDVCIEMSPFSRAVLQMAVHLLLYGADTLLVMEFLVVKLSPEDWTDALPRHPALLYHASSCFHYMQFAHDNSPAHLSNAPAVPEDSGTRVAVHRPNWLFHCTVPACWLFQLLAAYGSNRILPFMPHAMVGVTGGTCEGFRQCMCTHAV